MKRRLFAAAVVIAISGALRAEMEVGDKPAPAAGFEARLEAAAAKAVALADALKRLAEAGEAGRAEILDALRKSFAEAGKVSRAVTTVETRHEVKAIKDAAEAAPRQEPLGRGQGEGGAFRSRPPACLEGKLFLRERSFIQCPPQAGM